MDILRFSVPPVGRYRWSATPGGEIVDPSDMSRLVEIRAVGAGGAEPGLVRVFRDDSSKRVTVSGDGVRLAWRHWGGEVLGDRSAWDAFDDLEEVA